MFEFGQLLYIKFFCLALFQLGWDLLKLNEIKMKYDFILFHLDRFYMNRIGIRTLITQHCKFWELLLLQIITVHSYTLFQTIKLQVLQVYSNFDNLIGIHQDNICEENLYYTVHVDGLQQKHL